MNKETKAIELLRKIRPLIQGSGPTMMQAIYRSPAAQMRIAADELEAQEKLIREVDEFLKAN